MGGVPSETLVEDTELTLCALRKKPKIIYEPSAVAFTQSPATWSGLINQRTRWLGGYLQAIVKHFRSLREGGSLAWFGMPDLIFSNFLSFFLVPITLFMSFAFIRQATFVEVVSALLVSSIIEILVAMIAYLHDREDLSELALVPIARIVWPLFLFLANNNYL